MSGATQTRRGGRTRALLGASLSIRQLFESGQVGRELLAALLPCGGAVMAEGTEGETTLVAAAARRGHVLDAVGVQNGGA